MNRRDRIVQNLRRDTIHLTTKAGVTFEGVLLEVDDKSLLLTSASLIATGGEKSPADGTVVVPRADVAYIQKT